MIVVRVELWPGGDHRGAREIASAYISNVSGLADISDYRAEVRERAREVAGLPAQEATFLIHDHERRQSVWRLIHRVTQMAVMRLNRRPA